MKYLLSIRFLGSAYQGYQVQKNGPSVQAELNRAAEELFGYPCDIVGCSRTDSGVHAEMFSATVAKKGQSDLPTAIPPERVPLAMNAHLPEDIAVYRAVPVTDDFHARYDVKSKEYRYFIYDNPIRNPFQEGRAFQFRAHLTDEAIDRMNRAAGYFVGKHDFRAYMAEGSKVSTTERTVFSAGVGREGDCVVFHVEADGFLYNMVRIMTGTLLAVAEGKLAPEDIPHVTDSLDRRLAGVTAPAGGLYLWRVHY